MAYIDPVAGAAQEALNLSVGGANIVGVTPGTVAASKALIVDTNKDLSGLRNLTLTGTLTGVGVTLTGALVGALRTVTAKTADYTIAATDSGKVLTNRGASGAVTFTLPTVAAGVTGVEVVIFVVADQNVIVSAQTTGQLVIMNDAAANSVAYQTSSKKIGGGFRVICDGTSWLVMPLPWADGTLAQTITVTT